MSLSFLYPVKYNPLLTVFIYLALINSIRIVTKCLTQVTPYLKSRQHKWRQHEWRQHGDDNISGDNFARLVTGDWHTQVCLCQYT